MKKSQVKGDVDLFRKIAQNNNILPVSQIKNRSEYRRIMKLIPRPGLEIPGTTILYFEDFMEENRVKVKGLKRRLRAVYGHSLRIKNWRQVTVVYIPKPEDNRVLLLVEKKKTTSVLKDYLVKIELDNVNKTARLSIRKEEYDYEVPIYIDKKKDGKTRIRALSYKTYLPLRRYVYTRLNENGNKKRIEILRKNANLISDTSAKKDDLLRVDENIRKLRTQSRYISISMNLRALLFYIVHEDDVIQFNKSIECLAQSCKDESKTENNHRYDSDSKSKNVYQIKFQSYSREEVEDFPFLLPEYNNLRDILPINWTFNVLKKIGNDLKRDLELLSLEQLKYKVITEFSRNIEEYAQSLDRIGDRKFDNRIELDKSKKLLLKYCRQIRYLIKETPDVINSKTIQNLKRERQREHNFLQGLCTLIENNDRDVIPIDRMIAKSKLNSGVVSDVLELVESDFGQRYVITQTCIISKSKAETLKLLLRNLPLCENASKILQDNGIPRHCLRYDRSLDNIVEKLGFYTRRVLISSDYLHYIDIVREKIPKELRSSPRYWFLNTRFGRLQPFSNENHGKYCTITPPIKLYNKQNDNSFTLKTIKESSKIAQLRFMAEQLIPSNQ